MKYTLLIFISLLCIAEIAPAEPSIWDKVKGVYNTAKECVNVAVKGTELAAKKVAFETAKTALDAAIALDQADPKIAALIAENKSLEVAKAGLSATVATGKFGVEAVSELGQTVGKVVAFGFNLTKVTLDENVGQLKSGKLPTFAIEGNLAGKHFNIKVSGDIKDVDNFAKSVFRALKNAI